LLWRGKDGPAYRDEGTRGSETTFVIDGRLQLQRVVKGPSGWEGHGKNVKPNYGRSKDWEKIEKKSEYGEA